MLHNSAPRNQFTNTNKMAFQITVPSILNKAVFRIFVIIIFVFVVIVLTSFVMMDTMPVQHEPVSSILPVNQTVRLDFEPIWKPEKAQHQHHHGVHETTTRPVVTEITKSPKPIIEEKLKFQTNLFKNDRSAFSNSQKLVDEFVKKYGNSTFIRLRNWDFKPTTQVPFFLTALAYMRNKADYVAEWIEFHLLQGFDRFVIYDNLSTDNLHQVLEPYIRAGIVELVVWPLDYNTIESGPMGPRKWMSKDGQRDFENRFDLCLNIKHIWHAHRDCQRTAMMDGIARYRNRTVWMASMDVDEFFFVHRETGNTDHGIMKSFEDIPTARERIHSLWDVYDHMKIPCRTFGTNGYMETPPGKDGLPSRMNTERYRYGMSHRWTIKNEPYLAEEHYCVKSIVKGHLPNDTQIHHFYFDTDVLGFEPRTVQRNRTILAMNHYRYLSHVGVNIKVKSNTNWKMDYSRPMDSLLMEYLDYSAGFLVPIVRHNLLVRLQEYADVHVFDQVHVKSVTADTTSEARQTARQKSIHSVDGILGNATANSTPSQPIDMCVAFTHLEGEPHHLRRSVHSILQYLKRTEPDIVFETVLVTLDRPAPDDDSITELEYLSDLVPFLDHIEVMSIDTPWSRVIDRATDLCVDAPYILYMEDMWETRYLDDTINDRMRPGLDIPVLKPAMQLMDHHDDILEVWVGDTPSEPDEYKRSRSEWMMADTLPPMDRVVSNLKWFDHSLTSKNLRRAIWLKYVEEYAAELDVLKEHGKASLQHAVEVYQKSGSINTTDRHVLTEQERRVQMTIKEQEFRERLGLQTKSNVNDTKDQDDDTTVTKKRKFLLDYQYTFLDKMTTKLETHYQRSRERIGCDPKVVLGKPTDKTGCPVHRPHYRTMSSTSSSGLGVFRLGGTLKHRKRFQSLGRMESIADAMLNGVSIVSGSVRQPASALTLSLYFQSLVGRIADTHGFKSAQFCLMDPSLDEQCRIDPDNVPDKATTGIMWRQRLVLAQHNGTVWYSDRESSPTILPNFF